MPAASVNSQKATITSLVTTAKQHLFKQFPEHEHRLKLLLQTRFASDVERPLSTVKEEVVFKPALPVEEVDNILEKVRQLSVLPGLVFDKETELYLEQQLEDILGFGLSSAVNSVRLPFTKGIVESMPHLRLFPANTSSTPSMLSEAGTRSRRPIFGWQMPQAPGDHTVSTASLYWIALPIRELVTSSLPFSAVKQWAYKRKMLIINPTDAKFAIVEVLDEYSALSNKYQFGASPAVIREGLFWSPQNLGRSVIFFLSNSSTTPKAGVYSLT